MRKINAFIIGFILLVVLGIRIYSLLQGKSADQADTSALQKEMIQTQTDQTKNGTTAQETTAQVKKPAYLEYTSKAFLNEVTRKRVLFFHATWCPTCKEADTEFVSNSTDIPNDIAIFKVDYDTEKGLKEKYGITYQHTFVQVDAEGNQVAKWSGGGIKKLRENLR